MFVNARRFGVRGFTLTELLVVVAIIVLLTAIAVPNVARARTRAAITKTEADISNLATSLEMYRQAFGTYPGDVFPSEDINNDGVFDAASEDIGVNLDPANPSDAGTEYGSGNGVLDAGDGVVNILDLEWALRTSARGGPFIDDFPTDGWGQAYTYFSPYTRTALDNTTADDRGLNAPIATEDANGNGILDMGEDCGIGIYADPTYTDAFVDAGDPEACGKGSINGGRLSAGGYNGVLDHGDDDNDDGSVTWSRLGAAAPNFTVADAWELGNANISPDGYARNRGYYLYSVGEDGVADSTSGYEDLTSDLVLNDGAAGNLLNVVPPLTTGATLQTPPAGNSEDVDASTNLNTGFEDTGLDGRPNSKDVGEEDRELTTGGGSTTEDFNGNGELDLGGDDINSWNETRPWRQHESYN